MIVLAGIVSVYIYSCTTRIFNALFKEPIYADFNSFFDWYSKPSIHVYNNNLKLRIKSREGLLKFIKNVIRREKVDIGIFNENTLEKGIAISKLINNLQDIKLFGNTDVMYDENNCIGFFRSGHNMFTIASTEDKPIGDKPIGDKPKLLYGVYRLKNATKCDMSLDNPRSDVEYNIIV